MKKLLFSVVALLSTLFTASAINVDEAFDQLLTVPGVAVQDIPQIQLQPLHMTQGKVIVLMNPGEAAVQQVNAILEQITDTVIKDQQDSPAGKVTASVYSRILEDGQTRALMFVDQQISGGALYMVMYGDGDANMIQKLMEE